MTKQALIVVDMQNDFMEGGSLEVAGSNDIILPVNRLIKNFELVVATKDWHPSNHYSFARNCNVKPFETVNSEMKWPDHCIAGTWGSDFHKNLNTVNFSAIFHKGIDANVESYSGVKDTKGKNSGLMDYLIALGVNEVFVCGLALDYCVGSTAIDCSQYRWVKTNLVIDATKSVSPSYLFEDKNINVITTEQAVQSTKE